jgi:hypothetical protein
MALNLSTGTPAGLNATIPLLPGQTSLSPVAASSGGGLGAIGGLAAATPWGAVLGAAASAFGSFFGGPDAPAGPSGGGIFNAGGINVGSKVIGSGSASTSQPSSVGAMPGGGGFYTDNSASAGTPKWLVPVLIGVGVLILGLLFFPKRKSK